MLLSTPTLQLLGLLRVCYDWALWLLSSAHPSFKLEFGWGVPLLCLRGASCWLLWVTLSSLPSINYLFAAILNFVLSNLSHQLSLLPLPLEPSAPWVGAQGYPGPPWTLSSLGGSSRLSRSYDCSFFSVLHQIITWWVAMSVSSVPCCSSPVISNPMFSLDTMLYCGIVNQYYKMLVFFWCYFFRPSQDKLCNDHTFTGPQVASNHTPGGATGRANSLFRMMPPGLTYSLDTWDCIHQLISSFPGGL